MFKDDRGPIDLETTCFLFWDTINTMKSDKRSLKRKTPLEHLLPDSGTLDVYNIHN